jgi:hypothetical protein
MDQVGNWHRPDGTGRTVIIGIRENGKRLNVYESGLTSVLRHKYGTRPK